MKKSLLMLFMSVFCVAIIAQERTIKGKVIDEIGNSFPGVNVSIKNTTIGTITNIDGDYSITVPDGETVLTFSCIGYTTYNQIIETNDVINVQLAPDIIGLNEVVAIGYGVQKKSDLTGSVELIKGDKLKKQTAFQTSSALQGAVPGLTVIQSNGQPGHDAAELRIRGIGSMSISSAPLILIDGIAGDLNGIDAGDIENVTILKDAGAAAIYGSRASNGVILVTTKRGGAGKTSVTYNGYMGFQTPTNIAKMADAYQFLGLIGDEEAQTEWKANSDDLDRYPNTDWVDALLTENGAMQYHNFTVTGGNEKAQIQASLSYQNQNGNIVNFGFKRYQGRINTDFKVNNYLKLSLDANYRKSNTLSALAGAQIDQAYRQLPIYANKFSDGRWHYPVIGGNPALWVNKAGNNNNTGDYFRARMVAEITPVKDLLIKLTYSPEIEKSFSSSWTQPFSAYGDFDAELPLTLGLRGDNEASLSKSYSQSHTDNFNAVINYKKSFNSHNLDALVGLESIQYQYEYFSGSRYGYIIPDYPVLNNGNADNDSNEGSKTHYALLSYFGRLNYSFKDRYYVTANIRKDGSSRFHEDQRWGVFPSFSGGWNLHNEAFFPKNDFVTRLKLRGSWGQLGNESIYRNNSPVYFPYASLVSIGNSYYANDQIQQGAAQNTLANTAIKWEKSETTNIGIDYGILNNKFSGSIEYYKKKTKDLIATKSIPYTTGLSAPIANIYSMNNSGVDFSLSYRGKIGDLKIAIDGNFATVKNEVTNLGEEQHLLDGASIIKVGEALNSIYTYKTIGIFQSEEEIADAPTQFGSLKPGDLRYEDIDSYDEEGNLTGKPDGVINSADRQILGNPFPSLTYGFNINLDYKGFDLAAAFSGVGKRDVLLGGYLVWPLYNGGNAPEWIINESWTESNTDARYPVITNSTSPNNYRSNSTYIYNGSYLRLRNLTIGYTLPETIVKKAKLSNVRFYLSGQNLLTFDHMPEGIDPTMPNGSYGNVYPTVKSYTFGVNVTF